MEDDVDSILSGLDLGTLNGSTAPNSSPTGLSTPVNTSGGNTNTSGSLGGILSGLAGLGTTAAAAYKIFAPASTPAATTTTTSSLTTYLPWILIGGAVIALIAIFARK